LSKAAGEAADEHARDAMKMLLGVVVAVVMMASVASATDVGVSVEISQPGVYGRVDIGRFPQPAVIVPQPVIIAPPPAVVVQPEPVYVWVPGKERKHWKKYCHKYGACGVPVYFVRHDWYNHHVRYVDIPPPPGEGPYKGKHKHGDKHKYKYEYDYGHADKHPH
jgi:hypothetical protein